jgi:threonyl-tRNA synthetase
VDDRNEKVGFKIREAESQKIPYMLVLGDQEMEQQKIRIRRHGKGDLGDAQVEQFINTVTEEIKNHQ